MKTKRSIWDGSISFGLVNIPIHVFSATQDYETHFHFLHNKDSGRIHNERVCEICGKKIPYEDIAKGYEYEKGEYVILNPEDFEKVNLTAARNIDILDFVRTEEIDPMFFDKPYYLLPGKTGQKAYALFVAALEESDKVGLAKFVFRTRETLAAVQAKDGALVLNTMHFASEIKKIKDLGFPIPKVAVSKKELQMATQLIDQMSVRFQAEKYVDTYEESLHKMIAQKIKNPRHKISGPKAKAPTNVIDIMSKLKASLKKGAPAKKRSA